MNGDLNRRVGGLEVRLGLDAAAKMDRQAIAETYGQEAADALAAGAGVVPVIIDGEESCLFAGGKLIVGVSLDDI